MERISEQIEELEHWKAAQTRLLRRVFRWLGVALTLFAVGIIVALWQIDNLIEANTRDIETQARIDKVLVEEQYQINHARWTVCTSRNDAVRQQLRQDKVQLSQLITAHTRDRNPAAAKAWADYLKRGQTTTLPDCGPEPTRKEVP